METSELRKSALLYKETLADLVLHQKIKLSDIPFKIRKRCRVFYIYAKRVSRYNPKEYLDFIRLVFSDYDKLLKKEKEVLYDIVDTIMEWDKDVLIKNEIQPPKDYQSRYR